MRGHKVRIFLGYQLDYDRHVRLGFDEEGRDQLKNKLVDTHKWIGTAGV